MSVASIVRRIRKTVPSRFRAWAQIVVALGLNVPFLVAALSRFPRGLGWTTVSGLYAGLVFLGYYVLVLLVLLTALFVVTGFWTRLFLVGSTTLLSGALYYLVVDGVMYGVLGMHLDAFWFRYLFTTFDGMGIGFLEIMASVALLAGVVVLEHWIIRLSARVRAPGRWAVGVVAVSVMAFATSQVFHIAAYERNDTRITALTPQLPFYYPVTSHRNAVKHGDRLAMIREVDDNGLGGGAPESLAYPLEVIHCELPAVHRRPNILLLLLESWRADAMNPQVTPRMHAFGQRSSVFDRHFSTGNATPTGVFPLFYGLHPTYWTAVKVNNPRIDNPVLIDVLEEDGYAFGIYADSHFERHKIKDTVFRDIEVHETFRGETVHDRDLDLNDRLVEFIEGRQREGRPFFGFAFYKSTHYPYDYPVDAEIFQPTRELNVFLADADDDPTPVLNDYRNAVHYVDRLVGDLLDRMEESGLLENTIVVITSDHGEEFNDTGENYWGHTGNFTEFQTRVPLIVYVPWQEPRRVAAITSEIDIPATLLEEGLGCQADAANYSNGVNLFGPLETVRPIVVASYVNHALIFDDDVFVVWPMYVQRYKLDDIRAPADSPDPALMKRILEEMGRFYDQAEAPERSEASS